ncbi:hypothetical protein ACFWIN_34880, partial [Streptomyces sp. NPDC127049]
MVWFLGLGIGGLLLLVLSLVFDGVLEGLFDGFGGLDGLLSLPVVAGFLSALGLTGAGGGGPARPPRRAPPPPGAGARG